MSFDTRAFDVFDVPYLEGRMDAIRENIWPQFTKFGQDISHAVSEKLNMTAPIFVHIAKHARRTAYAPESTWVAIGGDKRGYKKYPHFQIGINDEYVFIVLACIDNPVHEKEIALDFAQRGNQWDTLPHDFVVIPDHTRSAYESVDDINPAEFFERVAKVKRAEFMLGRVLPRERAESLDDIQTTQWMLDTVDELFDWYIAAMSFYQEK